MYNPSIQQIAGDLNSRTPSNQLLAVLKGLSIVQKIPLRSFPTLQQYTGNPQLYAKDKDTEINDLRYRT